MFLANPVDPRQTHRESSEGDDGTATVGVTNKSWRCMNWRINEPSAPRRRFKRCTSSALSFAPSSASVVRAWPIATRNA